MTPSPLVAISHGIASFNDKRSRVAVYPGGKNAHYQKLINLMPPHRVYIETHLGSGAVMRNKRPASINYGIDLDKTVLTSTEAAIRHSIAANNDAEAQDSSIFEFICGDALQWLQGYAATSGFTGNELVYCDPPYLRSSRKQSRRLYQYEYTDQQHIELLDYLCTLPCFVMISGYASDLYSQKLKDWHIFTYQAQTRSREPATEYVWMNYTQPIALHDYSYLGGNFRERERIKRKEARWVNRLQNLPILERQALLAAIQETDFLSS